MEDGEAMHAGREVARLAEQVPEKLAIYTAGQAEVLHLGRPAHVDAQRPGFILVRAPREIYRLHGPQAPQRLRQALEADALAH